MPGKIIWHELCNYARAAIINGAVWTVDNHNNGWIRRNEDIVYTGNEHDSLDMLKKQAEHLARGVTVIT